MSQVTLDSINHRWVIGITGASGTVYARRLVKLLGEHVAEATVDLVISEAGFRVLREEDGIKISASAASEKIAELFDIEAARLRIHHANDIGATIASGTYRTAGMVVIPCSMGTLGAIASGHSQHLVHRAAEVTLKERRRLILVPRETPLSPIHLENLLKLSRIGVAIVPAMPGFYHQPQTLTELVDMMVMKVLDQMGYHISPVPRWKESVAMGARLV